MSLMSALRTKILSVFVVIHFRIKCLKVGFVLERTHNLATRAPLFYKMFLTNEDRCDYLKVYLLDFKTSASQTTYVMELVFLAVSNQLFPVMY